MKIDKQSATDHLDNLLELQAGLDYQSTNADRNEVLVGLLAALRRLAPAGSEYEKALGRASQIEEGFESHQIEILAGAARALRSDYANDRLQTFRELFNADLFSDFLEMATYLLQDEKLTQPAAVLAGGVLEEHIRKLCDKHEVATSIDRKPKKADTMNADLRKAGVYGANDQKQVTAWCGIRNSAAHAKYDEFDEHQVRSMIEGIRSFISRYPA